MESPAALRMMSGSVAMADTMSQRMSVVKWWRKCTPLRKAALGTLKSEWERVVGILGRR